MYLNRGIINFSPIFHPFPNDPSTEMAFFAVAPHWVNIFIELTTTHPGSLSWFIINSSDLISTFDVVSWLELTYPDAYASLNAPWCVLCNAEAAKKTKACTPRLAGKIHVLFFRFVTQAESVDPSLKSHPNHWHEWLKCTWVRKKHVFLQLSHMIWVSIPANYAQVTE